MKIGKLSLGLLLGIFLFVSCSKEEDDLISQNCESDCTQIIGKIMTDTEGNFALNFYIRDDEIEDGGFRIEYEINENEYIFSHLNRITIFQIARDTTLNIDYNIPKKAFLNLTLLNLDDIQSGDNLATDFSYERPDGFDQSIDGQVIGLGNESDENNLIEVAGNIPVELKVRRRINGVSTSEINTIFLEAGTTTDYTIDFIN